MSSLRPIYLSITILLLIMLISIVSFMLFESFSFMDALWLTLIAITTVGFGDIVPKTTGGRLTTIFLVVSGIWLFTYAFSTLFSGILEGHLRDLWGINIMKQKISKLRNHIVVCGAGRVGREVIAQLIHDNVQFVAIEKTTEFLDELHELGALYIIGDATEDKILHAAQIEHARGVVITLAEDTGNLFITMTCKNLENKLHIVARANRPENIWKLQRAGADNVICPSAIAGNRMALAVTKPTSVAYVQTLVENREINLELEELVISKNSPLANRELKDSGLREIFNVQLLAIKRGDKTIPNPVANEQIIDQDVLIVCGAAENLALLEKTAVEVN